VAFDVCDMKNDLGKVALEDGERLREHIAQSFKLDYHRYKMFLKRE